MYLRRPNWAEWWVKGPRPHPEGMGVLPEAVLSMLLAERELAAALAERRYDDARRALDAIEVWRLVLGVGR